MDKEIEDFLNLYSREVRELALAARELILSAMPGVTEKFYPGYKSIAYSASTKMADQGVYIAPLKDRVNLGFYRGTELPDPAGMLEGTGKLLRHIKLKRAEDLQNPALRALLEAAC
jgi:hypothetical protein